MLIDTLINKAKERRKKIVLVEGEDIRVLKASSIASNFTDIIIVGNKKRIEMLSKLNSIDINNIEIIEPSTSTLTETLIENLYNIRKQIKYYYIFYQELF